MYMKANNIPLKISDFEQFPQTSDWGVAELSLQALADVSRIVRPDDHLGGFISGSLLEPKLLNGRNCIAGFDVLVHEKNPKPEWNEGEVNAYHYVIWRSNHAKFPFILSGPYNGGTTIGHHPTGLDLGCYTD